MGSQSGVLAAPPDGDRVAHSKRTRLEQRNLALCLGCLTLIVLPLVGLVWFALDLESDSRNCSEHIRKEIASPRGQYIAQVVVVGCGGATVGPDTEVRLRSAGAEPGGKGEIVIEFDDGPVEKKRSVSWESEKRLLIEYDCIDSGGVYGKCYRWRDIPITYRCVDP